MSLIIAPKQSIRPSGPLRVFDESLDEDAQIKRIRKTVSDLFEKIPYISLKECDTELTEGAFFLKYSFPQLTSRNLCSVLDEVFTSNFLYRMYGVAQNEYDPTLGCHIRYSFAKHFHQAEDDRLVYETYYKKRIHALHCDIERKPEVEELRAKNPVEYQKRALYKRKLQMIALAALAGGWRRTGLFEKVFIPLEEFRLKELKECPGYVVATDLVILVYKKLPGTLPCGSIKDWAENLKLTTSVNIRYLDDQLTACAFRQSYEQRAIAEARPITQKIFDAVRNAVPWGRAEEAPRTFERETPLPVEEPRDRPAGTRSFFFRAGLVICAVFALIARLFRFHSLSRR